MPEESYSIKEMITEMRSDINIRFDKVDAAQAHTNGDVSSLKIWKGVLTGALTIVTSMVIPLVVYVWSEAQTNKTALQSLSSNLNKQNGQNYYISK